MSTFLTAEWRKLIMAQYEVSPEVLAPWLPRGLELDLYEGRSFVSLVGFLFDRVRVKGVAVPFHTRFEEINLRFYVARTMADGTRRRGVVFIREFVPRAAIALVAMKLYEEPYAALPTFSSIASSAESLSVEYAWKHGGRWHRLAVEASPEARPIVAGSIEEFITEHYWGYTKRSDGSTSEYQVEHPRWSTYRLSSYKIEADFGALYGAAFAGLAGQQTANVLLAEGSAVSVGSGARFGG
jgi:uncharacterized protein